MEHLRPLRRLPSGLDPKQRLFLDGIRHAAEIADFGYACLRDRLTSIAAAARRKENPSPSYADAFLFAWSIVDAIDRLRLLLQLMPGLQALPSGEQGGFFKNVQGIRDLRNVADHLAQRADYVVKHKGTALGILSWFTADDQVPTAGLSCAIIPGSIDVQTAPLINPIGKSFEYPTGAVTLHAGEHKADLTFAIAEARRVVASLEESLEAWRLEHAAAVPVALSDVLISAAIEFREDSDDVHNQATTP